MANAIIENAPLAGTPIFRLGFGVSAAIAIAALLVHSVAWYHGGRADPAYAANVSGMVVLMLVGALNPPSGFVSRLSVMGGVALVTAGAIATFLRF